MIPEANSSNSQSWPVYPKEQMQSYRRAGSRSTHVPPLWHGLWTHSSTFMQVPLMRVDPSGHLNIPSVTRALDSVARTELCPILEHALNYAINTKHKNTHNSYEYENDSDDNDPTSAVWERVRIALGGARRCAHSLLLGDRRGWPRAPPCWTLRFFPPARARSFLPRSLQGSGSGNRALGWRKCHRCDTGSRDIRSCLHNLCRPMTKPDPHRN